MVAIKRYVSSQLSACSKSVALAGLLISLHSNVAAFEFSDKLLEQVRHKHGSVAENRLREWQQMVKHSDAKLDYDKLSLVNEFINRAHRVNDADDWRQTDAKADPLEFLINHSGDGQDFAMAKLFTLHRMGFDLAKLRIGYVKSRGLNRPHTVLAYFETPVAEPLILDSIERRIQSSSARQDLVPIYLFDPRNIMTIDIDSVELPEERSNHIVKWQNLLPNLETVQY